VVAKTWPVTVALKGSYPVFWVASGKRFCDKPLARPGSFSVLKYESEYTLLVGSTKETYINTFLEILW
jgi:hypothetical protein